MKSFSVNSIKISSKLTCEIAQLIIDKLDLFSSISLKSFSALNSL